MMAILAIGFFIGCEDDSNPESPAESSVRISGAEAIPALVAPGDTTLIRARVVDRTTGAPVSGVLVKFGEIAGKDWGNFQKTSTETDTTGWAASDYIPIRIDSGQVGLRVQANDEVAYVTLQVKAGASTDPSAMTVALAASETSIPADGLSTLNLTITVKQAGAAVVGQSVHLTAGELFTDVDLDGVWSDGDILLQDQNRNNVWDAIGTVTDSVVTGGQGIAIATYTAGEIIGPVYIKASSEGVSRDLEIRLHATGTVMDLAMTPNELPADGNADAYVVATVTDPQGAAVSGKLVRFEVGEPFVDIDGDGYFTPGIDTYQDLNENGQWDSAGQVQTSANTLNDGKAAVTFVAGYEPGSYTLVASTRDSRAETSLYLLDLPPVARAELEDLSWKKYFANGVDRDTLGINVWDASGQPLPGQKIKLVMGEKFTDNDDDGRFTPGIDEITDEVISNGNWDELGAISPQVITNMAGRSELTIQTPEVAGTIWIKASAGLWSQDFPVEILPIPAVGQLFIQVLQDEISLRDSGGMDQTAVWVSLYSVEGGPMPAGALVSFRILSGPGTLDGGAAGDVSELTLKTNSYGQADVLVRAGTVQGTITLEVSSGAANQQVEIGVFVGPPAKIHAAPRETVLGSWESTTIEAVVLDAYNNPVLDGTLVHFSVDEGSVVGADGSPTHRTLMGSAYALYYSLSPQAGGDGWAEVIVSARDGAVVETTYVAIPEADLVIQSLEMASGRPEIGVQGAGEYEQTTIMATAYGLDGNPVGQGHPITFEIISGPNGGEALEDEVADEVMALTDPQGQALVQLYSGTKSGTVKIGASTEDGVTKDIIVGIAAGPPLEMGCPLYIESQCYAEGGANGVAVAVSLYDLHHNPVRNGTVIHFEANAGMVVGDQGLGSSTTFDGWAYATYFAPTCDDGVSHFIRCETHGGEVSCQFDVRLPDCFACPSDSALIARIELNSDPGEIRVQSTGGNEQTFITAIGYDAMYRRVGAGEDLTFRILLGPGGGESLNGLDADSVVVETNGNGEAQVVLGSGTISGSVLIGVSAENGASEMTMVAIAAGPPHYLSIGVSPCNIRGWDRVAEEADITVVVSDIYHNPVPDHTRVYFTSDEGIVRGAVSGEMGSGETLNGVCGANFLSGEPRNDGIVTVTATTIGGTVEGQVSFITSGPPTSVTFVSPWPPVNLIADGESEIDLMVEVLDINDNFVLGGTSVEFRTDIGTVGGTGTTADGCGGSIATDTYKSEVLDGDYSYSIPDNGIGAIATVTAKAGLGGWAAAYLNINLLTSSANKDASNLDIDTDVAAGSMNSFSVKIRDRFGNPLGGHSLAFTATDGTVTPGTAVTDMWGEASGLFTAPNDSTSVTLQVQDNDPNYGGIVFTEGITVQ
ncbi:MAG: hypothetical protein KJ970_05285 [Candidatus Eisenbacteria bacterium]|uniref:Big-1 domain-containing protein n=1 Tax=Eiseniibacteriota bacterium TaxID=2212470 RepID=A0A948WBV1_UNCEI|nr:hypothetical protein [Candidatus Eisenbacteria bacterium]